MHKNLITRKKSKNKAVGLTVRKRGGGTKEEWVLGIEVGVIAKY